MNNPLQLQNAFTGFVVLLFGLLGIWVTNEQVFWRFTGLIAGKENSWATLIGLIASSQMVGILVQSCYRAYLMRRYGAVFHDAARKLLADSIRSRLKSAKVRDEVKEELRKCDPSDDSLFVWLYYSYPEQPLIAWARRRRDMQNLFMNWAIAGVFGSWLGALIGLARFWPSFSTWCLLVTILILSVLPQRWRSFLFYWVSRFWDLMQRRSILIITILISFQAVVLLIFGPWFRASYLFAPLIVVGVLEWTWFCVYLSDKAKTEADTAELTWACAQLDPELKQRAFAKEKRHQRLREGKKDGKVPDTLVREKQS